VTTDGSWSQTLRVAGYVVAIAVVLILLFLLAAALG
jgi:hypothetical protein